MGLLYMSKTVNCTYHINLDIWKKHILIRCSLKKIYVYANTKLKKTGISLGTSIYLSVTILLCESAKGLIT